jgi:hypothetical protein
MLKCSFLRVMMDLLSSDLQRCISKNCGLLSVSLSEVSAHACLGLMVRTSSFVSPWIFKLWQNTYIG